MSNDKTSVGVRWVIVDESRGVQHAAQVYDQFGVTWARLVCIGVTQPAEGAQAQVEPHEDVRVCRKSRCKRLHHEHVQRKAAGHGS